MDLHVIWFVLIVVLFIGFFFLEGFDYGVGGLLPFLSQEDRDRSQILRTITPVWDGNEVWMITAGGALFASFPHVYATMFSTFYLALFLMLLALILRGVAFEFRGRREGRPWRRFWESCIVFGSVVPAILWGVAVTDLLRGLPIDASMVYTGGFFDLLSLYSVLGGLTFLFVFLFHGAAFLTLRLSEPRLVARARKLGRTVGGIAILLFVLCGYEHCIANLYYLPAGAFAAAEYGMETTLTLAGCLENLAAVTLGNLVGGAALGVGYRFVYLKE